MAGDYTRFTYDRARRYSGVWMQQGRVQLDADWNEGVEIVKGDLRALALDTFGPVGIPALTTPDAFKIGFLAGDLTIEPGRIYVDGWLAELFADESATYTNQPFFPSPPTLPVNGGVLVYLDIWEREVTYIQDPALLDVALGGVDTATRTQTVWQVKIEATEAPACGLDVGAPASTGRLTTEANSPPAPDDPCILPPQAGYRGLENRLYRIEIHDGGALGAARFKWSRDNGSIVSAVSAIAVVGAQTTLTVNRIGRDPVLRFGIGDWVTVTDDHRELHEEPGEMAQVIDIDATQNLIVLDRALPSAGGRAFGANETEIADRHTRVQRWDETETTNAIDGDGLIATASGPIDLEDGVRVSFGPATAVFRNGDYWYFWARTANASIEVLTDAPPRGIVHRYVQLAAITDLGVAAPVIQDCRPKPPEHDACCCCEVTVRARDDQQADFDDLASAIQHANGIDPDVPVIICLLEGDHTLPAPNVVNRAQITIRGCGWGTVLNATGNGGLQLAGQMQAIESLAMKTENAAPLLSLQGSEQRVENCLLHNQTETGLVVSGRASELLFYRNLVIGQAGVELTVENGLFEMNRFVASPLRIMPQSYRVRIEGNDLESSAADAIILDSKLPISEIDICNNRIRQALGSGIATAAFDPNNPAMDGIVDGLRIIGNEISECATQAERPTGDPPVGGIILSHVYDLIVRDNRIERNAEQAHMAVCGIYVRRSRGAEIARNVIRDNGRRSDGTDFDGPQAGISLRDAGVQMASVTDPQDDNRFMAEIGALPAARIADNLVKSRRGPALYIRGQGPMSIESNRFQALNVLDNPFDDTIGTLDQFVGGVFIANFGLPGFAASFLAGPGIPALVESNAQQITGVQTSSWLTGGQVQFRGNQVRLDLSQSEIDVFLANVAIISLDDTVIAGNQTEGVLVFPTQQASGLGGSSFVLDLMFTDLFSVALSTRQSHNGLMSTPYVTMHSILSRAWNNHCVDNQATSCIDAVGAVRQVIRDNMVFFPHPTFCPDDD